MNRWVTGVELYALWQPDPDGDGAALEIIWLADVGQEVLRGILALGHSEGIQIDVEIALRLLQEVRRDAFPQLISELM